MLYTTSRQSGGSARGFCSVVAKFSGAVLRHGERTVLLPTSLLLAGHHG